jgi:hypothetical protein
MTSYNEIKDQIRAKISQGQVEAWYHSKMLRIPHGAQHPKKRYLTDEEVIKLFTGTVSIQEKMDGKLSSFVYNTDPIMWMIYEDMTGKRTVHKHVMAYTNVPSKIYLDIVRYRDGKLVFEKPPDQVLEYGTVSLADPTIEEIHSVLEEFSKSPSHFGSPVIEGVVIKDYAGQRAGKWINEAFEDLLTG